MFVILFFSSICRFVVGQKWDWEGQRCSDFSNSSLFESQLFDSKDEKCHNMLTRVNLLHMKHCFQWVRGRFLSNHTDTADLQDRRSSHTCINASNVIDFDIRRNAAIAMSKTTGKSTMDRSCTYNCSEELPHGFFPLPFVAGTRELDIPRFPHHWYSVSEFHALTKGNVLFFRGNSLTRQLFQRIIMWIRSQSSFIEHFAHRHMVYGFDMAFDYWEICDWIDINDSKNTCNGSSEFWSTFRNKSEVSVLSLSHSPFRKKKNLPPTSPDFSLSMVPEFTDRRYLGSIVQIGHDTPHWRVESIPDGIGLPTPVNDHNKNAPPGRQFLNLPMHLWSVRNTAPLPHWPSRNRMYLCSNKTYDDAHFQCGAYGSYPNKIFEAKIPPDYDCSDPFNLNVWQWVLKFLFDIRVDKMMCNTSAATSTSM